MSGTGPAGWGPPETPRCSKRRPIPARTASGRCPAVRRGVHLALEDEPGPLAAASLPRRATPPWPTRPPPHPARSRVGPVPGRTSRCVPGACARSGGAGQVEAPVEHRLHAAQGPALVFPAVSGKLLGRLRLQLGELLLPQPRQRRRPLRPQGPRTALVPHLPPSLHRADSDPQVFGDH